VLPERAPHASPALSFGLGRTPVGRGGYAAHMTGAGSIVSVSPRDFDAVLFDLDGVLTRTASVHAAAWKRLFDEFLERHAAESGRAFVPFDAEADYRRFVDGKPREQGVAAFLAARGIELPPGAADDPPAAATRHGLGRRKDRYFTQHLERHGVETYDTTLALVRALRAQEVRTAVVSSSRNCRAVLEAAGIDGLFDARVDGLDLDRHGLAGKPAPDSFLEAARRLGVEPARAIVVEDAIAGVAAGRAGGFGLVLGVNRCGQSGELRAAGADVVVADLGQVRIATEPPDAWSLVYEHFDREREGIREALCALGNGYFATRGAAPWARADGVHYPGTYLAGGYNRLRTTVAGRTVENEDLVNLPNWLALDVRIDADEWFDPRRVTLLGYRQELDLRAGMLRRSVRFEDPQGRRSRLEERRFVSMADMHLAGLELTLTAENWSGPVTARSGVDGRVVNAGAKLYEPFANRHLEPLAAGAAGDDAVSLLVRTVQSDLRVAIAVRTRVLREGEAVAVGRRRLEEPGYVAEELSLTLRQGETVAFEYETIPRNVEYYDRRSSHGSTLCRVVHAWVLARSDRPRAMQYFEEALQSDVSDIQQGTTAEGIHLGAMAGTVDLVQRVSTGIELMADALRLNPRLPEEIERLDLRLRYRGHTLDLKLTRGALTVRSREPAVAPIRLAVGDAVHDFAAGDTRVFELG